MKKRQRRGRQEKAKIREENLFSEAFLRKIKENGQA